MEKTYADLSELRTFRERFEYLKLEGVVGEQTFGRARSLNQLFYRSPRWRKVRDQVILRDGACDLGIPGREIRKYLVVHHINPVTEAQIRRDDPVLYELENLICVSSATHNALHYGDFSLIDQPLYRERKPNDTCPWKKGGM